MNILAVGAHPDDVELGCFGTLIDKKRKGHNVYATALAPGAYGEHDWKEIKETWQIAKKTLNQGKGRSDYVLGTFPIGHLEHSWETVGFVDELIRRFEIDTLITHHYGESHQDHIASQRIAVSSARRNVGSLWLWESSIYTHRNVFQFKPQLYVPMSRAAYEAKMSVLKAYLDVGLLEPQEVTAHKHLAQYRGAESHREYAEAFEVVWESRED